MSNKKVYECVDNVQPQYCTNWQEVPQTPLPISKADANILTMEIISFMVFVFIVQQIVKTAKN